MKKILLSIFTFIVIGFASKTNAQCDLQFNNLVVDSVGTPVSLPGPQCQVTFSVSFDIITNSGFKNLFFHSWLAADYPNPPIFDCRGNTPAVNPGTAAQLGTTLNESGKSFLDIGFVGLKDLTDTLTDGITVDITSFIATTYPHDPTVALIQPSNSPGMMALLTMNGDTLHFSFINVSITLNQACNAPLGVYSDIWGSNSNAPDPKAQCYICKIGNFFGDPTINGFKNCDFPRKYSIAINTVDPVVRDITYNVWVDMNGNGVINPGTDSLAFTSDTISISAPGGATPDGYFSGLVSLPAPYSTLNPYLDKGYIIEVEYVNTPGRNSVTKYLPNPQGCIGLPATFRSFTAKRTNRTNVFVRWETLTEENVSGFAVERNISGVWEQVAFIPSQSPDGNSNSILTYQVNDLNATKGISQYRIRQVDNTGMAKISEIRSVRGEGQKGTTIVYPNPTPDGRVNVIFEGDMAKRNITVQDMSGRIIKQWNNYTNNNIQIENLKPGFYTIRIVDTETGSQVVEKVVVNNR